jgi:membrane-associated protease RseP (regulator of RpoE activity)
VSEPETNDIDTSEEARPSPAHPLSLFGRRPSREMSAEERRASLIRLLVVVGVTIAISVVTGALPFVLIVLALIAMIMLHELGHFVTAKWAGMKVTEYFLGFGPRLWSVRKGETEYGVKAIPAGGYVRIVGMSNLEQVAPADEARTYRQQSFPRRLSVAVAGSTVHYIIAFVLLFVLLTAVGVPNYDRPLPTIGAVLEVTQGVSPAKDAGLRPGDRVVAVNGQPVKAWDDLPRLIRARGGERRQFTVERDGETRTITIVPVQVDGKGPFRIGIAPSYPSERFGVVTGLGRSVDTLYDGTRLTFKAMGSLFAPGKLKDYADQVVGRQPASNNADRPVGVVGATRVAGELAQRHQYAEVLSLLIYINIFVGIFNMLPLLPFDGGHVAIAVYERIRTRRGRRYHADVSKLIPLTSAVVVFLIVFGAAVLYLDIVKPVSLQ